ncbi:MAG: helix-turn-helix domain-containing protein [Kineosporiaceae bacterium]|nr:helix-turn-helix domain-containing protein [Kineosporiaceae bacterium]
MQSRGLVQVARRRKNWTATITEAGTYYLTTGAYESGPTTDHLLGGGDLTDPGRDTVRAAKPRPNRAADDVTPDATTRAMRRVAQRRRPIEVKQTSRQIKETFMRYKVVVTRVQVAERFVRAVDEDDAAAKVQAEFDRPYGYFGSWKTTTSEVDVVQAEQTTVLGPAQLSPEGPMLLSIKDAAKALGISYSTLYQMLNQGEIEWVAVGSRKLISRQQLLDFIKVNTHRGYYVAR